MDKNCLRAWHAVLITASLPLVPRFGFTDTYPGTEESLLRSRSEFFSTICDVSDSATQIMSTRGQRDILSGWYADFTSIAAQVWPP
jgi:hypothetical protein